MLQRHPIVLLSFLFLEGLSPFLISFYAETGVRLQDIYKAKEFFLASLKNLNSIEFSENSCYNVEKLLEEIL
jgi:hypothetical protein